MTDDELKAMEKVVAWWMQPTCDRLVDARNKPHELGPYHVSILLAEVDRLKAERDAWADACVREQDRAARLLIPDPKGGDL